MSKDVIGNALLDYFNKSYVTDIIVKSSISDDDTIPLDYLFRSEEEMPKIERKALSLCRGHVLDVGAGSGCHSVVLQEKGLLVTAIDTSEGAVRVMRNRKILTKKLDFFKEKEKYDTLLFLMNGLGIAETLNGLTTFLEKAKTLLKKDGQIILDSSDISYMFNEEDGSKWIDLNASYYGEVVYKMEYKEHKTGVFNWLFADYESLMKIAENVGLNIEKVMDGDHHDYLARLWY